MSRERQRESGETLHHVVAATHACDAFVVRNPPAWQSGHSNAQRCESGACRSAVALARQTARDGAVCQERPTKRGARGVRGEARMLLVFRPPQETERNLGTAHVVQAPHFGVNMSARRNLCIGRSRQVDNESRLPIQGKQVFQHREAGRRHREHGEGQYGASRSVRSDSARSAKILLLRGLCAFSLLLWVKKLGSISVSCWYVVPACYQAGARRL